MSNIAPISHRVDSNKANTHVPELVDLSDSDEDVPKNVSALKQNPTNYIPALNQSYKKFDEDINISLSQQIEIRQATKPELKSLSAICSSRQISGRYINRLQNDEDFESLKEKLQKEKLERRQIMKNKPCTNSESSSS